MPCVYQVDACLLTAPAAPNLGYLIDIRGLDAERKTWEPSGNASEWSLPSSSGGVWLWLLRRGSSAGDLCGLCSLCCSGSLGALGWVRGLQGVGHSRMPRSRPAQELVNGGPLVSRAKE